VSIEPTETALLTAFARAASKAQEIEALFRDSLIVVEVHKNIRSRSFEDITREIDRLPLGELKKRFFKFFGRAHSGTKEMFDAVNADRIFLMHNFFQVFPIEKLNGNKDAAIRLERTDEILGTGLQIFRRTHETGLAAGKIPPTRLREIMKFVVEHRKKAEVQE
jgi:hypothetical protein